MGMDTKAVTMMWQPFIMGATSPLLQASVQASPKYPFSPYDTIAGPTCQMRSNNAYL